MPPGVEMPDKDPGNAGEKISSETTHRISFSSAIAEPENRNVSGQLFFLLDTSLSRLGKTSRSLGSESDY